MTGFIVFETHGGSRLSDYWQQKTKSSLSRVHVTPRKTLFTRDQEELPSWWRPDPARHMAQLLRVGTMKSGQVRLSLALKRVRACLHTVYMFRGRPAQVQLIWTHLMSLQLVKLKRM